MTPCYNSDDVIHFDLVFPYKGSYYRNLFEFFLNYNLFCYIIDIFTVEELANQRYLDRAIYSAISLMTKQALIRYAFPRVELIFLQRDKSVIIIFNIFYLFVKLTIASDGNLYARSAVFPLPPPQCIKL